MLVDLAVLVAGMDRGSLPGFSKVMHETKPHHGKCKNPQQHFADGEAISIVNNEREKQACVLPFFCVSVRSFGSLPSVLYVDSLTVPSGLQRAKPATVYASRRRKERS